jgi:WhiB family redox-sensing transcriptional regulator
MSAAIDPADDDTDMWTAPAADYDLPTFTSAGSQAWRADAACRGMDTAVFFPGRGQSGAVAAAKAICNGCPVAAECLTEAMLDPMNSGIWGASSHRQRRIIRSTNNPTHAPARKPIAHGSVSGYESHQRRRESPCDDCRDAYNTHHRNAVRKRRALARTATATHTDKAAA